MPQYPIEPFATPLPPEWQSMAKPLPHEIQPIEQPPFASFATPPYPGHIQGHPVQWQNWQSTESRTPLLIVVFLSGLLIGGTVSALFVIAIAPKTPPTIVIPPEQNISNPRCRLFCGN